MTSAPMRWGEPRALLGSELREGPRLWVAAGGWVLMGWALFNHIWGYHLCTCTGEWAMGMKMSLSICAHAVECVCVHGVKPSV